MARRLTLPETLSHNLSQLPVEQKYQIYRAWDVATKQSGFEPGLESLAAASVLRRQFDAVERVETGSRGTSDSVWNVLSSRMADILNIF